MCCPDLLFSPLVIVLEFAPYGDLATAIHMKILSGLSLVKLLNNPFHLQSVSENEHDVIALLTKQLISALIYLQEKRIIHRDIKPAVK